MAKAPDFSQQMATSNFQGYVEQGIVDKSEAIKTAADFSALSQGIGLAYDTYTAYYKSKVLGGISEQIDALAREQQGRSLVGMETQKKEILQQRDEFNRTLDESDYDGSYPLNLNTSLNKQVVELRDSLMEKTDRFIKAKEQGAMTDMELSERLSALYREETTRNPAYQQEIKSHISILEDQYNLKKRVAYDKAIVDGQADSTKKLHTYIIDQVKDYPSLRLSDYLDPDTLQFTQEGMQRAIQDIEKKTAGKALYEQVERDVKMSNLSDEQAQKYILNNNMIPAYANGSFAVAEMNLNDIFRDVDPENASAVAEATNKANSFMLQHIRKFKDTYSAARGNATINLLLNEHETDLKALQANIKSFADGTYKSESLARVLKIQEDYGKTEFYKKMGPEKIVFIDYATKIFGKEGFELNRMTMRGKEKVVNSIYDMLKPAGQQLLLGLGINPDDPTSTGETDKTKNDRKVMSQVGYNANDLLAKDEKGVPILDTILNNTANIAKENPDNAKLCTTFECQIDLSLSTIKDTTLNENDRFKFHEQLINRTSSDDLNIVFSKIESGTRAGVKEAVDGYNRVLVQDMQKDQLDNPDRSYKFSIDGFGYIMPESSLNRVYANKMNKALGSYANAMGKTRKEAAEEFMQTYFPSQISGVEATPDSAVDVQGEPTGDPIEKVVDQIAIQESSNKHMDEQGNLIVNPKSGAVGKYQIMPDTARDPGYGVAPLTDDTEQEHRRFATEYYNAMLKEFDGDPEKALAAYNAGPGVIKKAIQQEPDDWLSLLSKETRDYVADILKGLSQKK